MAQSFAQIYLHIVFSTKNRRPYFHNALFAKELHAYIAGICKNQNCLAQIIGGHDDHLHLLCSLSRRKTVADLVRDIKANSCTWIKVQKKDWSDFHWQDGYGAFSVSQSQVQSVREYIDNQREHHREMTFQEEFRKWLSVYDIPFDEKYVWR